MDGTASFGVNAFLGLSEENAEHRALGVDVLLPAPVFCTFRTGPLLVVGSISSCDCFDRSRWLLSQAVCLRAVAAALLL